MKGWQKVVLGVGTGVAAFYVGGFILEKEMLPSPKDVELGDVRVSIHLPTINEEGWIEETLQSLVSQPLYQKYKGRGMKLVVLDSHSTDRTVEVARNYADAVLEVPHGKLSARHAGIERDDVDIIVAVDAGDFYPEGWLSTLLEPFSNPNVVAAHGPVLSKDPAWKVLTSWYNLVRPTREISGRNSAFRTWAYREVGGFDLSINQLDRNELVIEEEVRFRDKLRKVGDVVFVWRAGMFKTERARPFTLEADSRISKYKEEITQKIRF